MAEKSEWQVNFSSYFNVCNSIIGAGSLTIPYAFKNAGFIGGTVLMIWAAFFSLVALYFLTACSEFTGVMSYKGMAVRCFGPKGGFLVSTLIIIYTLGSIIGYSVLLADFFGVDGVIGYWDPESSFANRGVIIFLLGWGLEFPLSLPRDLSSLGGTSTLAILFILYVAFMCLAKAAMLENPPSLNAFGEEDGHIFLAFPLTVVAYSCHYNGLRFYQELGPTRNMPRMLRIFTSAMITCATVYLIIGFSGYYIFGENTDADILNSFSRDDKAVLVARIFLGFIIIFSYPLVAHPLRDNIYNYIADYFPEAYALPKTEEPRFKYYYAIAYFSAFITFAIGYLVPTIDIPLGFNGTTIGVSLVYLFPASFYLKLTHDEEEMKAPLLESNSLNSQVRESGDAQANRTYPVPRRNRLLAKFTFVAGIVLGLTGLVVNIWKQVAHP